MKINELFSVRDKIVLITGSSRGIGYEVAKGFIENGAKVIIHGSREATTKASYEKLGAYDYVCADLGNMKAVFEMIEQLKSKIDSLDVLINNAGFEEHCPIDKMTEEMMDNMYNINTKSHYFLTSRMVPLLKLADAPSIINITSIHQLVPVRNNSPYCMSKASMAMMTQVSALEFGPIGIRVNNLAPGAIRTDMNAPLFDEFVERGLDMDSWVPLGRVGEVEEMIGPCIFLASQASSYITGATLYADGGYKENLLRY